MHPLDWIQQKQPKKEIKDVPFVTLTYAQTLDGMIGALGHQPLLLSCPESMELTHALRSTHDAILVGIQTILSDNPRLTCRYHSPPKPTTRSPFHTRSFIIPVILDSYLRCPLDAKIMASRPILCCLKPSFIDPHQHDLIQQRQEALEEQGATIIQVDRHSSGSGLNIEECLKELYLRNIHSVMIEGGQSVIQGLLSTDRRLVDWLVVTVSPCYVGQGVHVTQTLQERASLTICDMSLWGCDMVLSATLNK